MSCLHEAIGITAHAIKEAMTCPTGHHTESNVKRPLEANGRNSRNKAPSTGRLPPTPMAMHPKRREVVIHDGPREINVPKRPQMSNVALKAGRRPIMSDAMPQMVDPKARPMKVIMVVYLTWVLLIPYSTASCGSTSASPCIQRLHLVSPRIRLNDDQGSYLSASQPIPHKVKSCH